MIEKFFLWWRETVGQIKNTRQELGVSKSTIKGSLYKRCLSLVSIGNGKNLEFAKNHVKNLYSSIENKTLWPDEMKISLHQNDEKRWIWRREGTTHEPKHSPSSVKHGGGGVMPRACVTAKGTVFLEFIDGVSANKSNKMKYEVFGPIIWSDSAKCLKPWCFTVNKDNHPKHSAKATFKSAFF